MPCYDSRDNYPSEEEIIARKMPAVLCGLVRSLGYEIVLSVVDWKSAGVTQQEFMQWWRDHLAEDERKARIEDQERRRRELRQQAESKLTPEELQAIKGK